MQHEKDNSEEIASSSNEEKRIEELMSFLGISAEEARELNELIKIH